MEQDVLEEESRRLRAGAEERDLSVYSSWRAGADPRVLEAIGIYARYLMGQHAGMTDALSLTAVVACFELESIPRPDRPELAGRILTVHQAFLKTRKDKPRG